MAFLESNGLHYRACCDGCGAIGPLGEEMSLATKEACRRGWVATEGRLACEKCVASSPAAAAAASFEKALAGLPTKVLLDYAHSELGDVDPETGQPEVKRASFVLQFSEAGFGFGEVTVVQTEEGVFVDTERMSLDRVKRYMTALLDSAITDYESDPERHALYNRVMKSTCGPRCPVCYPTEVGSHE